MVKNLTPSAEDLRDVDLILESGRSPGEENATHSSILVWRTPWTEKPCGLQSMGQQESDTTQQPNSSNNDHSIHRARNIA